MPDVFTKSKRSQVMSAIRAHGNKDTEVALMQFFRRHRITGWRRHLQVFGLPDFVFPKLKLAVFVDGCFWHRCPTHSNFPVNNRGFWRQKLDGNKRRDRLVTYTLRTQKWQVCRVWEHELTSKNEKRLLRRFQRILGATSVKEI
jgi:DNA mismatch endonuclease (patch repair protein)